VRDGRVRAVGSGAGRLLVAVYAVFALSASSRAGLQLVTEFDRAPVAYLLSAVAAGVYLVATVALWRGARRLAYATVLFELVGVLVVGTLTVVVDDLFPDQTVWSTYGSGYGFIPLVLPVLGLWRLHATR
jgi:spore maturation protein SpmA